MDRDFFREKLAEIVRVKNKTLEEVYHDQGVSFEAIYQEYSSYGDQLTKFVTDTSVLVNRALQDGKKVLFEGAQGTLLDIDHGTYPFVSSSSSTSGGACTGTGVGPTRIDKVVGVLKAYSTRVGEGPFPTELSEDLVSLLRDGRGREYGATTGRPRRCGWFDGVIAEYSVRINGVNSLVVMKLDVLDGMDTVKLCTGYRYRNSILKEFPARNYLQRISELAGAPVSMVSVGWRRDETVLGNDIW